MKATVKKVVNSVPLPRTSIVSEVKLIPLEVITSSLMKFKSCMVPELEPLRMARLLFVYVIMGFMDYAGMILSLMSA